MRNNKRNNIASALLAGGEKRAAVTSFAEEIMSTKEAAERGRERTIPGRSRKTRRMPTDGNVEG